MLVSARTSLTQNSRAFRLHLSRSFTSGNVDGFTGAVGNTPLVSLAYARLYALSFVGSFGDKGSRMVGKADIRCSARFISRSCLRRLGLRFMGKPSFRTLVGVSRIVRRWGSSKMLRLLGGTFSCIVWRSFTGTHKITWDRLKPGGTVVEGTAGNTGIGLAHVCRARGYRCVIFMPNTQVRTAWAEDFPFKISTFSLQSQEKIDLLKMLGAEVYPVPAVAYEHPKNYNHQAKAFAQGLPNAVWTDQFDNVSNARAHYETTGPEIWEQTRGTLDAFTCATGTGGTLAGVGKLLKEKSGGKTQVWLADPPGSVLHSYVQSGGKLKERSGGSITEGYPLNSLI